MTAASAARPFDRFAFLAKSSQNCPRTQFDRRTPVTVRRRPAAAERCAPPAISNRRSVIPERGLEYGMEHAFVVLRSRGPAWDDSKPLEDQSDWAAHAAFMNQLFEQGFAVLVGPLEARAMRCSFFAPPQHPRSSSALLRIRGRLTASS